jgi:hypothetical protein
VSDDEEIANLLKGARARIVEYARTVQEATWELAVHAAMRGDLAPAMKKLLEGKVPPSRTRAALAKALARAKEGRKGQPPIYRGPLYRRELARTPLLRARQIYQELREQRINNSEEALELAVRWVNENPLQHPPKLVQERCRGKVTVSQLRNEIRGCKARRKMRH